MRTCTSRTPPRSRRSRTSAFIFLLRQFPSQRRAGQIHAAFIERAGDIGEVNPLKKTVRRRLSGGEAFDARRLVILDDDHFAGFERANLAEAEVEQRHAFAGGGK